MSGGKKAAPSNTELEQTYIEQRSAEQRDPCTSCGKSDDACTIGILRGGGIACCTTCARTDTHPRPDHDDHHYSTQATFHLTPPEARKLAIELLSAAEQCNRPDKYVRIHSFGKGASAWKVENFTIRPM